MSASKSINVLVVAASILNTEVVYFINCMIACCSKSWSRILCSTLLIFLEPVDFVIRVVNHVSLRGSQYRSDGRNSSGGGVARQPREGGKSKKTATSVMLRLDHCFAFEHKQ